jgi:hypothetical protein
MIEEVLVLHDLEVGPDVKTVSQDGEAVVRAEREHVSGVGHPDRKCPEDQVGLSAEVPLVEVEQSPVDQVVFDGIDCGFRTTEVGFTYRLKLYVALEHQVSIHMEIMDFSHVHFEYHFFVRDLAVGPVTGGKFMRYSDGQIGWSMHIETTGSGVGASSDLNISQLALVILFQSQGAFEVFSWDHSIRVLPDFSHRTI